MVVLASVFLINLAIFVYFTRLRAHLLTDLSEPLILFLLGYHSNPTDLFHGVSKDGTSEADKIKKWRLTKNDGKIAVAAQTESDASEEQAASELRVV